MIRRVIRNSQQADNVATYIKSLEIPEDGLDIRIQPYEETRTLEQNNFMWRAAYQPIAEQIGEATGAMLTKDDIHHFCKDRFAPREIRRHPITGIESSVPKSTTKFTKQEMSDYLEKVFSWASHHGVWFE